MNIRTKDAASAAQYLADGIAAADKNRSAALTLAIDQIDAAVEALRLERVRLAFKYGEASPRVAGADARIRQIADDRRVASAEAQRSRVDAPTAKPSVATLYGRVIDANQLGVQGLTVRARRADDGSEIDRAGTNEVGYFTLSLRPGKTEAATIAVMVEVLSANCRVAYGDSAPRDLQIGEVAYAEIEMMSAGNGPERPPSPGGDKSTPPTRGVSGPPLPSTRKPRRQRSPKPSGG